MSSSRPEPASVARLRGPDAPRGRRAGLLATALLVALAVPPPAGAGEYEAAPGSPAWSNAVELAGLLPGRPHAPDAELQVLAEALAIPGLVKARKAVERFDFDGLRIAMSELLHGMPGTLSRAGALRAAAQLVPSPAAPWNGLPPPLWPREFEDHVQARQAALATASGSLGAGREKLAAFIQREPRELASRLPGLRLGELWPGGFVSGGGLAVPSLLAVLAGVPSDGPIPATGPAAVKVQTEYLASAWGRRSLLRVLKAQADAAFAELGAAIRTRRIRVTGVLAADGPADAARPTVSLAGGRLGTQVVGADLRFALDCELGRLAPLLAEPGSLILQVVRNREVVLTRSLGSDRLFSLKEARGDPKLRLADLGSLSLPVLTSRIVVAMPGFRDLVLRTESEEEARPTTALVRLSGHPSVEQLGEDGSWSFGDLIPGLKVASVSLLDAHGEVIARALGSIVAKPGAETRIVLAVPVGEAPLPVAAKSPEKVRGLMEDLVGRYKKGEFGPEALKAGIGEIYRMHRAVTGDPAKDKVFAVKAAEAMAQVMRGLDEERAKKDPAPAIAALEEQFDELGEILPDLLRGARPAERLRAYLEGSLARAFPPSGGEHRSTVHRRRMLRESAETISELDGLVQFLEDVLVARAAKLEAGVAAALVAFREAEPLLRLAGSADYEERLLHLVEERLLPLQDLVAAGTNLKRSLFASDLRDRLADETADLAAVEAGQRALAEAVQRMKKALDGPLGKARSSLAELEKRRPAWSPWLAWLGEFGRNAQVEPASRGQAESIPVSGTPRVWNVALELAQREIEPLLRADEQLGEAGRWHQGYEKLVRGRLAELHDLEVGAARLEELAALDPHERDQAVSLALPGIYDKLKVEAPPAPPWAPGLPRRLEPKVRALLGRYLEEWAACAAWRGRVEAELARLEGLAAAPDPDPVPVLAGLLPLREGREAWAAPASSLIDDPMGKALTTRAAGLEAKLRTRLLEPGAWARLTPPWPDELVRRGWPVPPSPPPPPGPGGASGPSPVATAP